MLVWDWEDLQYPATVFVYAAVGWSSSKNVGLPRRKTQLLVAYGIFDTPCAVYGFRRPTRVTEQRCDAFSEIWDLADKWQCGVNEKLHRQTLKFHSIFADS